MSTTRSFSTVGIVTIGLFLNLACVCTVHAGFMEDFCGSTSAEGVLGDGIDGTVNFAVVKLSTASPETKGLLTDAFNAGYGSDAAFDADADYAYLYQAVNDGLNQTVIDFVTINLNGAMEEDMTSWGYFAGVSLEDAQGQVGVGPAAPGNRLNAFGQDGVPFTVNASEDVGVVSPNLVGGATDLAVPSAITVTDAGNDNIVFHSVFMPIMPGQKPLYNFPADNHRSTVIGFTSDMAPDFDTVAFQDGGGQALGRVASVTTVDPVPEPSSLMMLGMAGLGLLLSVRRRLASQGSIPNNSRAA